MPSVLTANRAGTGKSMMRRSQRLIAAAVLVALTGVLGGCSSSLSNFDPSDLLDFLDTKKKLPGERKPVFPEGVPGLEQGVPKDLYKGAQQQPDDPAAQAAALQPPPVPAEEPKAKKGRKAAKQAAAPVAAAPAQEAAPQDGEAAAAGEAAPVPDAPKPKKIVRRRTTAPPPDAAAAPPPVQPPPPAQQSASPFPAPMPSGTFSR